MIPSPVTRVLFVEDNALDAHLVLELLAREESGPFAVSHVSSLANALNFLDTESFAIVLLDLGLPDSFGLNTLLRLRAHDSNVPVLVLTATEDESLGMEVLHHGAQDYIPKNRLQGLLLVRSIRYAIERHRAALLLRETNESLSRVISSASDAIITMSLDGLITGWNPAAQHLFGYTPEEVLGKPIHTLVPPNLAHQEDAIIARIRNGERVDHFETIRLHKNGAPLHVSVTLSPIRDTNGNIIGASNISRDISAQKRAEDALRASEAHHRQFIEEAPVCVAMFDKGMRYLAASRRWAEDYGKGRANLVGLLHYELHPDLPERWKILHRRVLAGEVLRNDRDRWVQQDGTDLCLRWAMHPWHNPLGEIGGIIVSAEDITQRVRAEEALRFHENLLRETGHISKVGGWEFEVATGKGYWTEEVARIHELPPDAQPTREMGLEFYLGESRNTIARSLQEAIVNSRPYDLELELLTAKGNRRWVRTIAHPVLDDDKIVKLRGSFQDITERKVAEGTLRRQASLIDQVYDAVIVWERDAAITFWNSGAERIYGFSKQQAIGRVSHDLLQTESPAGLDHVLQSLDQKGSWEGELEHTALDGKRIVVESRMVLITQEEKKYVLETNRDMSEKRLLEAQLRQSQKMEAIGQLAGGVAHDFNNLLGVILGHSELLSQSTDQKKIAKGLDEIRKAAQRAANLTRQLLAFSRKQLLEPKVLDLNAKLSELTQMLERLVGENIDIRTSFFPSLGRVRVDPGQIEQILLNLVVNARDAMPHGGKITIETRNVECDETYSRSHASVPPGRYIVVAVSDSGIGMDAETQARIFEPFFTTKKAGTGLGLATVYGAVKQSEGNIWVYSEPGKGTTFKIYFPSIDDPAESSPSEDCNSANSNGSETILLVEDSESLLAVTKEFLELAGYHVQEARDGEQALQVARAYTGPIHLLLTDVVMPGMSGPDLAKTFLQLHPETRVLFISGYTADAIVNHGVLDDRVSLLTKPFSRAGLTSKVRELLNS